MLAKSLKDAGFAVVAHDPMASGPAKTVLGDAAPVSRRPCGKRCAQATSA